MGRHRVERDPVCGRRINRNRVHITIEYEGRKYLLCCPLCQSEFEKDPRKYQTRDRNRKVKH